MWLFSDIATDLRPAFSDMNSTCSVMLARWPSEDELNGLFHVSAGAAKALMFELSALVSLKSDLWTDELSDNSMSPSDSETAILPAKQEDRGYPLFN